MKHLIILTTLALVASAYAARVDEKTYVKPGSAEGVISVLNQQTIVDENEFRVATAILVKSQHYMFSFTDGTDAPPEAKIVITLVADASLPPLIVAPEAGWAKVNISALRTDAPDKMTLAGRARREFLRALAFAFSAGGSQFPGNVMSASEVSELDTVREILPFDVLQTIAKVAEKRGLKPEIVADYATACQEGWAPNPSTPEEQKIWDEVHEIPTEPIRITFDPTTDSK